MCVAQDLGERTVQSDSHAPPPDAVGVDEREHGRRLRAEEGHHDRLREDEVDHCRGGLVSDKARQQLREPSARELDQQGMVGAMTSSGSSKSAAVIISL